MTEAGQGDQRGEPSARLWLMLSFHACLILFLGGASLLFVSLQKVSWIADGRLCTWLLLVMVLMLLGLLARLVLHRSSTSSLEAS